MKKLYAMVTARGTACLETVLTAKEYADPVMRAATEARALGTPHDSPPVAGSWTDVSENEACQEAVS